jgi:tungstate transport system substrate-binding protein
MRTSYVTLLWCFAALIASGAAEAEDGVLLLATTTSVRDSGLLDELLPVFEQRAGVRVKTIAVGTGAALRMGAEGNVDVLLTHAPAAEQELLATGAVVSREPFMENYFVIAGPSEDPAGIHEAASPVEAYRRLAGAEVPYVSRGDDSGTHKRERALLRAAELPESEAWAGFTQTGTGMGLSLQVAGERRAYILSDIGTFLAYRARVGLTALSKESPELRNVYSILRVDPEKIPDALHVAAANEFAAFLVAPETQERIASFGVERFGRPLFRPLVTAGQSASGAD